MFYVDMCVLQIWSSSFLPNEPAKKDRTQREYWLKHGKNMLLDYVNIELSEKVIN